MKNFVILIIQLCGFAFLFVSVISLFNMLTGWHIGFKGTEVPAEPGFAIAFFVLGMIVAPVGMLLNKRFTT